MKKFSIFAALAALCLAFTSCGDSNATDKMTEGVKGALGDLDLTDMDAVKAKGGEMLGSITSSLSGITDEKGATSAVAKITGMLPALGKIKETMGGDFMTGMKDKIGGLGTAMTSLTTKFKDNAGVMGVLKPLLDKIKPMLGM